MPTEPSAQGVRQFRPVESKAAAPMKVFFVLHVFSHTRHFHSVFEELLRRGHTLDVFGLRSPTSASRVAKIPDHAKHIQPVTYRMLPLPRGDVWERFAPAVRASRNTLIYTDPRFRDATVFRDRAFALADPALVKLTPACGENVPGWLDRAYSLAEAAIPADPQLIELLQAERPDVLVVSPLIFNEMLQLNDWVKAAHVLGIPVAFPVFSWDNLTTKGSTHELPDEIWVWNELQRREGIEIHRWPADRIKALGAWRFDDFASYTPSYGREEFCARHGFDPARPIILWLGSAPIVAPTEAGFVADWLDAIRAAADPVLRTANVFIRPHPRNLATWKESGRIFDRPGVACQPIEQTSLFQERELFDLIHCSDAVVGLVTSAMLEAAIVRKPVHTILTRAAGEGQEGTVHFEYLTTAGGGLLYVADDLQSHAAMLAPHLHRPHGTPDARAEAFVQAFIDPPANGATGTATVRFAYALEGLSQRPKAPRTERRTVRPVRKALAWLLEKNKLPIGRKPDADAP